MNVDNRQLIRLFLQDHLTENMANKEFYKFEVIVRTKDNPDNKFVRHHKGSFMVHSWLVSSVEQYDKYIEEMVSISELTGGRLYMSLDRKSTEKMVHQLADESLEILKRLAKGNEVSTKNTMNLLNSISSKKEVSVHHGRKYMFDIDKQDGELLGKVLSSTPDVKTYIFPSPNGFHVVMDRFNREEMTMDFSGRDDVDLKENALTIVYFNQSGW